VQHSIESPRHSQERFPHYHIGRDIRGRPGHLLVGETHYLVHGAEMNEAAVVCGPPSAGRARLSCVGCGGELGSVDRAAPPVKEEAGDTEQGAADLARTMGGLNIEESSGMATGPAYEHRGTASQCCAGLYMGFL
jgi:hypothetical protein